MILAEDAISNAIFWLVTLVHAKAFFTTPSVTVNTRSHQATLKRVFTEGSYQPLIMSMHEVLFGNLMWDQYLKIRERKYPR